MTGCISESETLEALLWCGQTKPNSTSIATEFLLSRIPDLVSDAGMVFGNGSRWPRRPITFLEFKKRYEKKPESLTSWSIDSLDSSFRLSVDFHDGPCLCIRLLADRDSWRELGGCDTIQKMTALTPVAYGHIHPALPKKSIATHITVAVDSDSERFDPYRLNPGEDWTVAQYELLRGFWKGRSQHRSLPDGGVYLNPALVFEKNFVSNQHLTQHVREGTELRRWISMAKYRGSLRTVGDNCFCWSVNCKNVERVVSELWREEFFWAARYFEISGWVSELNIPQFRQVKAFDPTESGAFDA